MQQAAPRAVRVGHHLYPDVPIAHLIDALADRARPLGAGEARVNPVIEYARGLQADDHPIDPSDVATAINDLFDRHGAMQFLDLPGRDGGECAERRAQRCDRGGIGALPLLERGNGAAMDLGPGSASPACIYSSALTPARAIFSSSCDCTPDTPIAPTPFVLIHDGNAALDREPSGEIQEGGSFSVADLYQPGGRRLGTSAATWRHDGPR